MTLVGKDGRPEVRQDYGSTQADIRKALRIATERQAEFLAKWQEIHGGTD